MSFLDGWLPGVGVRVAASFILVVALAAGFFIAVMARGAFGGDPADMRTLHIRSSPADALITLNGERIGTTPIVVDVRIPDGAHRVKITQQVNGKPSGTGVERKLTLKKSDRFLTISENLLDAGKLVIETRPPGARLLLDGADVGKSPLVLEKVSTDKAHVVEARLDGYAATTATVPIDRGAVHQMVLTLASTGPEGRIVLESSPPAELWMDGQPWGRTGDATRSCPAGTHEVSFQAPGMPRPVTYTVEVPERGVARYFFELTGS